MIVCGNKLRRQLRRLKRWYPHEAAEMAILIVESRATAVGYGHHLEIDLDGVEVAIIGAICRDKDLLEAVRGCANATVADHLKIDAVALLARDAVEVASLADIQRTGRTARDELKSAPL